MENEDKMQKIEENKVVETEKNTEEVKKEEVKKEEVKKEEVKKEEVKKEEVKKKTEKKPTKEFVVSNLSNLKVSTKYAISICKFIKNKTVEQAILDLNQVVLAKKVVPMKGEIPHRHGKGIMSGRFPKRSSLEFISVLKSALANAAANGIEEPVIVEAIANIGNRPFARGGIRRKRTHLKIKLKNKKIKIKK